MITKSLQIETSTMAMTVVNHASDDRTKDMFLTTIVDLKSDNSVEFWLNRNELTEVAYLLLAAK